MHIFIKSGSVFVPAFFVLVLQFRINVPMPKYGLKLLMFKLLLCVLGEEESCTSIAKAQEVRSS